MEQPIFDRHTLQEQYDNALISRERFLFNRQRVESIVADLEIEPIIHRIFPNYEIFEEKQQSQRISPNTTGYPDHIETGFTILPVFYDVFVQEAQLRIGVRTSMSDPLEKPHSVIIFIGNLDILSRTVSRPYKAKHKQQLKDLIEEILTTGHPSLS